MGTKEDDFLRELLETFKIEASEHVKSMTAGLIALENEPDAGKRIPTIDTFYREAHSLKGASRAVGLMDIEATCQALESVVASMKQGEIGHSPELFDLLHKVVDTLGGLLDSKEGVDVPGIIRQLDDIKAGRPSGRLRSEEPTPALLKETTPLASVPETEPEHTPSAGAENEGPQVVIQSEKPGPPKLDTASDSIRVSTQKLDDVLLKAEGMLGVKLAARQIIDGIRNVNTFHEEWLKELGKFNPHYREFAAAINQQTNIEGNGRLDSKTSRKLLEFFELNHSYMHSLQNKLTSLAECAVEDVHMTEVMTDGLLDDVKSLLMLPFSTILGGFPKLVRDLSRELTKDVELIIEGEDVEVDKRILQEMKDPLIHLVRNCVDHGIERPEERESIKKSPRGVVKILVTHADGKNINIVVSDDGAGVDIDRLKEAAVNRGVISLDEAGKLSERDSLSLVYISDVSTSPIITELSGRGIGMTIVREKVEKLGGSISIKTDVNIGTEFHIRIPLTLATFRGIIVTASGQPLVIPTANVERVLRVRRDEIETVEGKETVPLNGFTVPVVRLEDILELMTKEQNTRQQEYATLLILGRQYERIAFVVDEVLSEQEIMFKDLGKQLTQVRNVSGATLLGTGEVVPILNPFDLMKSAVSSPGARVMVSSEAQDLGKEDKSVLIAEDSITSRTLLKNILESAGYRVKTTVDGLEAYTALKEGAFDILISDIEMPRMNGFELTRKVRSDNKLAELPVVLVTSLQSPEDRERGIDSGADAYIQKSGFDQSNLLETIRRLMY